MARTRVLILLNSLAPYGAENFVLNHARFANRDEFEVIVAHMGGSTALADKFREAGVEVVDLARPGRPRYTPAVPARLAWELRRRRIDVIQTHIGLAGVVGRTVGRAAGVKVVSTEQTVRADYPPWLRRANDATFPLAHRNVFISRAVVRSFAEIFPRVERDPIIISNGIDTQTVAKIATASREEKRRELGLGSDDLAFGNVGRLHPNKGQRFAIQALAKVRAAHPRVSLWIAGAGDAKEELEALALAEGVGDAVHLLGQRMDIHALLGAFDAYVHPATTEALGIAVLEAMAAGLPTVASSVDGLPEFVRDGDTGWLAPPRDPDALAERMRRVIEDRTEAMEIASRGVALIRSEHDVHGAVAAYEAVYRDVVSSRRTRRAAEARP
jgi:glycosyltransferase involved in cell wall biosynthesis